MFRAINFIFIFFYFCVSCHQEDDLFEENIDPERGLFVQLREKFDFNEEYKSLKDLVDNKIIYDYLKCEDYYFLGLGNFSTDNFFLIYEYERNKIYQTRQIALPRSDFFEDGGRAFEGFLELVNDRKKESVISDSIFYKSYFDFFYRTNTRILDFQALNKLVVWDSSCAVKKQFDENSIGIHFSNLEDILILTFVLQENYFLLNAPKYYNIKYFFLREQEILYPL